MGTDGGPGPCNFSVILPFVDLLLSIMTNWSTTKELCQSLLFGHGSYGMTLGVEAPCIDDHVRYNCRRQNHGSGSKCHAHGGIRSP